jgi:hypothetical protein
MLAMNGSAGYSGTPLPKKLGIRAHTSVTLVNAPDGFERVLGDLPDGVVIRRGLKPLPQMAVFFVTGRQALVRALPKLEAVLDAGGGTWVAWPKKTSGVATDLTEDVVRDEATARRLVDIKVCAIDRTWSGLRIARRRTTPEPS